MRITKKICWALTTLLWIGTDISARTNTRALDNQLEEAFNNKDIATAQQIMNNADFKEDENYKDYLGKYYQLLATQQQQQQQPQQPVTPVTPPSPVVQDNSQAIKDINDDLAAVKRYLMSLTDRTANNPDPVETPYTYQTLITGFNWFETISLERNLLNATRQISLEQASWTQGNDTYQLSYQGSSSASDHYSFINALTDKTPYNEYLTIDATLYDANDTTTNEDTSTMPGLRTTPVKNFIYNNNSTISDNIIELFSRIMAEETPTTDGPVIGFGSPNEHTKATDDDLAAARRYLKSLTDTHATNPPALDMPYEKGTIVAGFSYNDTISLEKMVVNLVRQESLNNNAWLQETDLYTFTYAGTDVESDHAAIAQDENFATTNTGIEYNALIDLFINADDQAGNADASEGPGQRIAIITNFIFNDNLTIAENLIEALGRIPAEHNAPVTTPPPPVIDPHITALNDDINAVKTYLQSLVDTHATNPMPLDMPYEEGTPITGFSYNETISIERIVVNAIRQKSLESGWEQGTNIFTPSYVSTDVDQDHYTLMSDPTIAVTPEGTLYTHLSNLLASADDGASNADASTEPGQRTTPIKNFKYDNALSINENLKEAFGRLAEENNQPVAQPEPTNVKSFIADMNAAMVYMRSLAALTAASTSAPTPYDGSTPLTGYVSNNARSLEMEIINAITAIAQNVGWNPATDGKKYNLTYTKTDTIANHETLLASEEVATWSENEKISSIIFQNIDGILQSASDTTATETDVSQTNKAFSQKIPTYFYDTSKTIDQNFNQLIGCISHETFASTGGNNNNANENSDFKPIFDDEAAMQQYLMSISDVTPAATPLNTDDLMTSVLHFVFDGTKSGEANLVELFTRFALSNNWVQVSNTDYPLTFNYITGMTAIANQLTAVNSFQDRTALTPAQDAMLTDYPNLQSNLDAFFTDQNSTTNTFVTKTQGQFVSKIAKFKYDPNQPMTDNILQAFACIIASSGTNQSVPPAPDTTGGQQTGTNQPITPAPDTTGGQQTGTNQPITPAPDTTGNTGGTTGGGTPPIAPTPDTTVAADADLYQNLVIAWNATIDDLKHIRTPQRPDIGLISILAPNNYLSLKYTVLGDTVSGANLPMNPDDTPSPTRAANLKIIEAFNNIFMEVELFSNTFALAFKPLNKSYTLNELNGTITTVQNESTSSTMILPIDDFNKITTSIVAAIAPTDASRAIVADFIPLSGVAAFINETHTPLSYKTPTGVITAPTFTDQDLQNEINLWSYLLFTIGENWRKLGLAFATVRGASTTQPIKIPIINPDPTLPFSVSVTTL